ncbi:hypothetical protein CYMTET_29435, partial [Cymbomonas tetramitiformis]
MVPARAASSLTDAAPPGGSKAIAKKASRKSMINPSASAEHKKEDESIKVYIRCRPLRANEAETTWSHTKTTISENSENSTSFSFDQVYPNATQTYEIFNDHLQRLADGVLAGFNSSFFCYGQTGSGKTHTMLGDKNEPGTLPRLAKLLCEKCTASETHRYLMRVSYFEIYNDEISDLLSNSSNKLKITDHSTKGPICVGAVERFVTSEENCMAIVDEGQIGRRVASTQMNEQSSRSHTIFRITVESRPINEGEQAGLVQLSEVCQEVQKSKNAALTVSMLNLIDLAGSERVAKTGAEGQTLKEGTMINKSLTTLSKVINELTKGGAAGHIPYRDSKLTRMLQPALGGNSRCATVCCISTADAHKEETLTTLRFASRCKLIENKAVKNVVAASSKMLQMYKQEIEDLKAKLENKVIVSEVGESGDPPKDTKDATETTKENVRLRLKMASLKKREDFQIQGAGDISSVSNDKVHQMKVLLLWQKGINSTMHRKSKERQEILDMELERINALSVTMSTELKLEKARNQLVVQDLTDQIQIMRQEMADSGGAGGAGSKELQAENKWPNCCASSLSLSGDLYMRRPSQQSILSAHGQLESCGPRLRKAKVNAMWQRALTSTMIKNLTESNALLEEENVRQAAITARPATWRGMCRKSAQRRCESGPLLQAPAQWVAPRSAAVSPERGRGELSERLWSDHVAILECRGGGYLAAYLAALDALWLHAVKAEDGCSWSFKWCRLIGGYAVIPSRSCQGAACVEEYATKRGGTDRPTAFDRCRLLRGGQWAACCG